MNILLIALINFIEVYKMTLKRFPRGGKKPNLNISCSSISILKKKKKNHEPQVQNEKRMQRLKVFNTVQNLKYSILHKGMIILGRIFRVTNCYIIVSLPGRIKAKLQATDISDSYNNILHSISNNEIINEYLSLSDIYKEGDYVICCIKDFYSDSKKICLSLNPYLINKNLNPRILTIGSKVILSIKTIEDHGYDLETGLTNLRAFLPSENVEIDVKFYPGKQIICVVKDIRIEENIFTAKVSVESKYVDRIETNVLYFDYLIPGVQYSLTVEKVLKNGLKVYYSGEYIGFINQFYLETALSSFIEGQQVVGRLLYVVPIIKIAYFSLVSIKQEKKWLKIGDVVKKAKVISLNSKGIFIQLSNDLQGFIPLKHIQTDYKKFESEFFINSVHTCKVEAYDLISKLYICTIEKQLIDKYSDHIGLKLGDRIEVIINSINENKKCINVSTGAYDGIIPLDQISDPGSIRKLEIGQNVTARVLKLLPNIIFTLKKSLLESKLPILFEMENAKINSIHDGSIVKITNEGIIIKFFGDIKGWIPKQYLNPQMAAQNWNFVIGQTVTTVIKRVNIKKNKIILALSNIDKTHNLCYKVGDIVQGVVINSSIAGIHVQIKNKNNDVIGFLPTGHISPCYEIANMLATKSVAGDILYAIVFSVKPLILSSTFAPERSYNIHDLNINDNVLCSISKIFDESIKVLLPITESPKYIVISKNEVENWKYLYENQILFGKILKIDNVTQSIELTIKLNKIWRTVEENEIKTMAAIDLLSCYLNKVSELSKNIYYLNKSISKINIGERISGTIENLTNYGLELKLKGNIKGIVCNEHFVGNYEKGDQIEGSVLWVNYPLEYVEITLLQSVMNTIKIKQNNLPEISIGVELKGEITLVTNWFVLVILKGQAKGTIVSLPVRRHLNDTIPNISPYKIGRKVRCYGILNKKEANLLLPICMLKSVFETYKFQIDKPFNSVLKLKRQIIIDEKQSTVIIKKLRKSNSKEDILKEINKTISKEMPKRNNKNIKLLSEQISESKDINNDQILKKRKANEVKRINYNTESSKANEVAKVINNNFTLNLHISKCGFRWNNFLKKQMEEVSSSDSENEFKTSKKKKLSLFERNKLERQKERNIREHEEMLSSTNIPQTVDQFDRLLLSSPDSSLVWMYYMAYYLQATEIDKARIIGQRALKIINFREETEKLNIWQALLNLESKFGSSDSLATVFQEALKMNNAKKIYEHMLNIYVDSGKYFELEKIINNMINKFKQYPETWVSCGAALLKIGMKNKSRQIMQNALQSLPKNKHIDLMISFAQLENKFGEKERSQTLFEQILSSYPKRTSVWSFYVDSLIKSDEIEIARKVLDRAIIQPLPARKMKFLFKKYLNIEQRYGTTEKISRIQELARKYIEDEYKSIS